jgi:Polyketide cyclase / dehydrase and lipid transport
MVRFVNSVGAPMGANSRKIRGSHRRITMTTIQRSILIDASLETVFAYISDYTHDGEWRRGVIHVEQTPPPPSRLGTHTHEVFRCLGVRFTICTEVTQFKANSVIGFTALDSAFPLWGQRMVKTDATAVRFTYALTARLHGVYGWLRPLLVWQFDRQIQRDLRKVKYTLEQRGQMVSGRLASPPPKKSGNKKA